MNRPTLLGDGPVNEAAVQKWLSFAAYDVMVNNFRLRLHYLLGLQVDLEAVVKGSHAALKLVDNCLADGRKFLELGRLTIADLAVYPYIALTVDGKIDLAPYTNVSAWIDRIKHEDWYVGMGSIEKP
jgi:glutathione S-transferase